MCPAMDSCLAVLAPPSVADIGPAGGGLDLFGHGWGDLAESAPVAGDGGAGRVVPTKIQPFRQTLRVVGGGLTRSRSTVLAWLW